MIILTEQQRVDALRACEAIEVASAKMQAACKKILEIIDDQPLKETFMKVHGS